MPQAASYTDKIAVKDLLIHIEPYQEPRWGEVPSRLKTMGGFDERFCPTLTVATLQGGGYAVIDGLARAALAQRDLGDEYHLSCQVLTGLTYEERAEVFLVLDRRRKNISSIQRFHAEREARKPRALMIVAILEKYDFTMATPRDKHRTPSQFAAITAVEDVYEMGETVLGSSLWALRSGLDGDINATDGSLLRAIGYIIKTGTTGGGSVDLNHLAKTLHNNSLQSLLDAGRAVGIGNLAGDGKIAAIRAGIIRRYNHRGPQGKRALPVTWNKDPFATEA